MLDLKRLRHFVATAEEGKVTRAAHRLNLTQSALTRSIQGLESSLNVALFIRGANGLELTAAGRRLMEHAGRILATTEAARADIMASTTGMRTQLRLGVSANFMSDVLPPPLFDTMASLPNLTVSVVEGLFGTLVSLLLAGKLDMLFTSIPKDREDHDIEIEPLITVPVDLSIVARSDHPLMTNAGLLASGGVEARWVFPEQAIFQAFVQRWFKGFGIMTPTPALLTDSHLLLKRAVVDRNYLAVVPDYVMRNQFADAPIMPVPGLFTTFPTEAGLVYTRGTIRSEPFIRLRRHVRAACQRHARQLQPG